MRGVPAPWTVRPALLPCQVLSVLLQPVGKSALQQGGARFTGLVASVRVWRRAVKPTSNSFLIRLHRERWGRTPHKVTTGTGVPMLFHTGASVPFFIVGSGAI